MKKKKKTQSPKNSLANGMSKGGVVGGTNHEPAMMEHINAFLSILATNRVWAIDKSVWNYGRIGMRMSAASHALNFSDWADGGDNRYPWEKQFDRTIFDSIEVIDVSGIMMNGVDPFIAWLFDICDTDVINQKMETARDDYGTGIDGVMMKYDSPGGSAQGLADTVARAKDIADGMPVMAYTNTVMASAAFYHAAACNERSCAWDAFVGSVGTYSDNVDISDMLSRAGIEVTELTTGKMKSAGSPILPLTDEKKDYLQGFVDQFGERFVSDVSEYTGIDKQTMLDADGRCFIGDDILKHGYADQIETFGQALTRFSAQCAKDKRSSNIMGKENDSIEDGVLADEVVVIDKEVLAFVQDAQFKDAGLTPELKDTIIAGINPEDHVKDDGFDIKGYASALETKISALAEQIDFVVQDRMPEEEELDDDAQNSGFVIPVLDGADKPDEGFGCLYFSKDGTLMQRIGDDAKEVAAKDVQNAPVVIGLSTNDDDDNSDPLTDGAGYSPEGIKAIRDS